MITSTRSRRPRARVHWTLGAHWHYRPRTFAFQGWDTAPNTADRQSFGGEITVYATSGDSGNDGRDKKMHKEVLEAGNTRMSFSGRDRVEWKIAPQGSFTSRYTDFLFAWRRTRTDRARSSREIAGDHWTGKREVNVLSSIGASKIRSNFFLKVNHAVEIELELRGSMQNSQPCNPKLLFRFLSTI